jgi:hypothetical protein
MDEHTEQRRMPGEIREEDIPRDVMFHGPMHPPEGRRMVIDEVFLPSSTCMKWQPDAEFNHYVLRPGDRSQRIYDWTGVCREVAAPHPHQAKA